MAAFLFATAAVAVLTGLVGLLAGPPLWLWRTAQEKGLPLRRRQAGST
jgi:hypothetical protein